MEVNANSPHKTKNRPVIWPRCGTSLDSELRYHRGNYPSAFIAALLPMTKSYKQHRFPKTEGKIKKAWLDFSAIQKSEVVCKKMDITGDDHTP